MLYAVLYALLQVRKSLDDAARSIARAIAVSLGDGEGDCGSDMLMKLKTWLSEEEQQIALEKFQKREADSWTMTDSAGLALREVTLQLQAIILPKGALMQKLHAASFDKLKQLLSGGEGSGMQSLGATYVNFEGKFVTWQKTMSDLTALPSAKKSLLDEAETLSRVGRIVLACQSCS